MSGLLRDRKMLMETVIIIRNGTVTHNVLVVFTRICSWSVIQGKTNTKVDLVKTKFTPEGEGGSGR